MRKLISYSVPWARLHSLIVFARQDETRILQLLNYDRGRFKPRQIRMEQVAGLCLATTRNTSKEVERCFI